MLSKPTQRPLLHTALVFIALTLLPLPGEARWATQAPGGRAVFAQERPYSCVLAATRMALHTMTGRNLPEGYLRQRSTCYPGGYRPNIGTQLSNAWYLLREQGVNASYQRCTLDGFEPWVRRGDPALVSVRTPAGHHCIVVDGVFGPRGSRQIYGRDPGGFCYGMDEREFCQVFNNEALICQGAACQPPAPTQPRADTWPILFHGRAAPRAATVTSGPRIVVPGQRSVPGAAGAGPRRHARKAPGYSTTTCSLQRR